MKKTLYVIESGQPSWHQQRAGHWFAGTLIVSFTDQELATYKANMTANHERFLVTPMDKLPPIHPARVLHEKNKANVDIQSPLPPFSHPDRDPL